MILVAHPARPWEYSSGARISFIFLQISFWEEVSLKLLKPRNSEKGWGTSIVARVTHRAEPQRGFASYWQNPRCGVAWINTGNPTVWPGAAGRAVLLNVFFVRGAVLVRFEKPHRTLRRKRTVQNNRWANPCVSRVSWSSSYRHVRHEKWHASVVVSPRSNLDQNQFGPLGCHQLLPPSVIFVGIVRAIDEQWGCSIR